VSGDHARQPVEDPGSRVGFDQETMTLRFHIGAIISM
jgi:hypothetical protein